MAVGHINDQVITLISYYAPNTGQMDFFHKMFEVLLPKAQGQVILGGDINLPLDQILDKSSHSKLIYKRVPKSSGGLARLLHNNDLTDAWREDNPSARIIHSIPMSIVHIPELTTFL